MKRKLFIATMFLLAIGILIATPSLPRDRYGLTMQFEKSFAVMSDSLVATAADSIQVPVNTTSAIIFSNVIAKVRVDVTTTADSLDGWIFLPANVPLALPVYSRGYIVYVPLSTAGRISIIWCKME